MNSADRSSRRRNKNPSKDASSPSPTSDITSPPEPTSPVPSLPEPTSPVPPSPDPTSPAPYSQSTPTKRIFNPPLSLTALSPSKISRPETAVIGYIHNISNQRRNRMNTLDYSSFVLQTSPNNLVHGLLYSKHKRPLLLESANNHTPIKLRDITYTKDGKVVVNDMTNISTPQLTEYNFQFNQGLQEREPEPTTILNILNTSNEWDFVSLRGKIISLNEQREVGSPRKRYNLVEAVVADESGSIPLDIWENHIKEITKEQSYTFTKVNVRIWGGNKKLATTPDTKVAVCNDDSLINLSVDTNGRQTEESLQITDIDSIQSIEQYLNCQNCKKKIMQGSCSTVVKCDSCGFMMRSNRCKTKMSARIVVLNNDAQQLTLKIDEDILSKMLQTDVQTLQPTEIAESLFKLTNFSLSYNSETYLVTNCAM